MGQRLKSLLLAGLLVVSQLVLGLAVSPRLAGADPVYPQKVWVSQGVGGAQANGVSPEQPVISANGAVVAFPSRASNLVSGDTNNVVDIFARDLASGSTERVSVTSDEQQISSSGDGNAARVSISNDGRLVGFESEAGALTGLGFERREVFIRDRVAGTTTRVSTTSNGTPANSDSLEGKLAANGEWITFTSGGSNLVAGDSNGQRDVFIKNLGSGTVERVSVATGGTEANNASSALDISSDGRFIIFTSTATNIAPAGNGSLYIRDRVNGTTERIAPPAECTAAANGFVSDDGRWVALLATQCAPGNGRQAVLLDRQTSTHVVVPNMAFVLDLSADGRYLVAHNNSHPFRYDRDTSTNSMFATSTIERSSISTSGNSIAYLGFDSQIPGDTNTFLDVFVHQSAAEPVPDSTPPAVSGNPDRQPNAAGWYNANVTIDWQSADPVPSSGTPTDPANTLAATQGQNVTYTSAPSCDPAGNCATGSVQLSIDKTVPALSNFQADGIMWRIFPETRTFTVSVSDPLSGLQSGEFYLDTDPGQGNGMSMTANDATYTGIIGSSTPFGFHTLYVRAQDKADNWSSPLSHTFFIGIL